MKDRRELLNNRWYVVKTKPNCEIKAVFNLDRQGFETYLPRHLCRVRHARKTSWLPRPLFTSYLFVSLSEEDHKWRAINSTFGVSHLISDNRGPLPVPHGIVEALRDAEDDQGLVMLGRKKPFRPGDTVQIMSGAFAEHIGRFESVTGDERVVILLDLLGRDVRTTAQLSTITAAT
jgi:transcriptional antiterminator RfaH